MIILKEQNTAQTFSFIPRELKATTIVLRNESTGSETTIAADFFLSDYYLTTTSVFNLKENTFYNLSIKNNNDIVYKDKVFCTNQETSTYTVNQNQYATPTIDDDDYYITPETDEVIGIGTQIWTTKNLEVSTYKNGDIIPEVTNPLLWAGLTTGAWCYWENNIANGTTFGKLYNWHAVNDPRGLAPDGYHIPSNTEWNTLYNYLGGASIAGGKMKSTGTSLWTAPNTGATNESGFTGLPGGFLQGFNGAFNNLGIAGYWWSSLNNGANNAYFAYVFNNSDDASIGDYTKVSGFSVRLIKDI